MITVDENALLALVAGVLLPMFRVLGLFTTAPVLSQRAIPMRARVGLGFAIALLAAPGIAVPASELGPGLIGLAVHEVVVGLVLGLLARLVFTAFEIAGEVIGLQMGLSFAGFFDPQSGSTNAVSRFLNLLAVTAFVALNGPGLLVAAVVASFRRIPIDADWSWYASQAPVAVASDMFGLALAVATPFLMLIMFVNLALGIMSRVAPQFSVFAVGFPLTIGAGVALLTASLSLLGVPIETAMQLLRSAIG